MTTFQFPGAAAGRKSPEPDPEYTPFEDLLEARFGEIYDAVLAGLEGPDPDGRRAAIRTELDGMWQKICCDRHEFLYQTPKLELSRYFNLVRRGFNWFEDEDEFPENVFSADLNLYFYARLLDVAGKYLKPEKSRKQGKPQSRKLRSRPDSRPCSRTNHKSQS